MQQYKHGGDHAAYTEQYGGADYLDFSANINPMGLPESARRALEQCADQCTQYPDPHCRELRRALSAFEQVPQEWILCGNGAADLIYRTVWALRPKTALIPAPTFAEYALALGQAGCSINYHDTRAEDRFALDESFLAKIPNNQVIFLCNPNNPTGNLTGPVLLDRILDACAAAGSVLVVDECFLEFVELCDEYTIKRRLGRYPRLLVLRAFTKIYAMPGLRLGYLLCSDRELLGRIAAAGAPWSVSVPAQLCGIAAAGEQLHLAASKALVRGESVRVSQALTDMGVRVFASSANFLLFYTGIEHFGEQLFQRGIVLRDCISFRGLGPGYYRAAIRTRAENNALLKAVKELT